MFPAMLFAQQDPPGSAAAEMLASSRDAEIEEESAELFATQYTGRKLNVNTAPVDVLMTVPGITDNHAKNLIAYRAGMGKLLHIYELQRIPGWDAEFCRSVRVYFTVSDPAREENIMRRMFRGQHSVSVQAMQVLQKAAGYTAEMPAYPGSPQRILLRYRYNYPKKMQWGLIAEKDAGEKLPMKPGIGFDHYSFHLVLKNWKNFESIAVGDYKVNLGQGLLQWQSLAFNKSTEVVHTMRQGEAVKPNQSASETGYYRGIAATYKRSRIQAVLFASRLKRDANLATDSAGILMVTSLLNSGLHRTISELADRKVLLHTVFGGSFQYRLKRAKLAFNMVSHSFSRSINKAPEPYNRFSFRGNQLLNGSFDYALPLHNFRFFGEVAGSRPGGNAMVHGVLFNPAPNVDISMLYRNISLSYHSFESSAFTETSEPAGERGLFSAAQVKISPVLQLSAFADHFNFPFYRFRLHGAGRGSSYLLQARLVPDKRSYCTIRFGWESKNENNSDDEFIHQVGQVRRKTFRIQAGYPVVENFSGASRVEVGERMQEGFAAAHSFLIYSEINYKAASWSGALRVQFMDIPDYQSRLYVYEHSGSTSGMVRMVYGKGYQFSIRFRKKFFNDLTAWLSASNTVYTNASAIGSGNDELSGRQKTALNLQVIYEF